MTGRPDRPLGLGIILVLGALTAVGPLSLDAYLPAFPQIAADLGVGQVDVQLSLTACLVGIAVGQIITGPWTDAIGRRLPLIVGAVAYSAASVACVVAPSIGVLVAFRFVQGLAGAVGVVTARAVVRDVATGPVAVRLFSQLSSANAVAPVLAPVLGALVLLVTDWHGVFVVLAVFGALLAVLLIAMLRETLPIDARHSAAPLATARGFGALLADRGFTGSLLLGGLGAVLLFAYVSGSSFVLQEEFGAEPVLYAAAFAINGTGIAMLSQVNARFAPRVGTGRMLRIAFAVQSVGAIVYAALALFAPRDPAMLPALMAALFVLIAPMGIVTPSYLARGMARSQGRAGAASAVLGATTFLVGGVISPLTGLGDPALTIALLVVIGAVGGLVAALWITRGDLDGSADPVVPAARGT